jgi:hypothetical protein
VSESPISRLLQQPWPSNRANGDYRKALAETADQELRRGVCLHCEKESPLLDGPSGRAWWQSHKTKCAGVPGLRLVAS